MKKRVILINPPASNKNSSPPLCLAFLGAKLLKHSYIVKVIDASASNNSLNNEEILDEIMTFNPHVIGITIMTPFVKEAYFLLKKIKKIYHSIFYPQIFSNFC